MRKKKILFMIALLCAIVQGAWADDGWSSASSYDQYSDADKPTHYDTYGGRSDVHVIKTAANYLYVMDKPADYCNKNIYLDINVDVSSKTWINLDYILGLYRVLESWGSGYRGTFYGNGHTIRINLDYDSYGSYKGPFGVIAKGGKVQDLNVEGTIFLKKMDDGNGTDLVGGICGENNGTIENCSVSASVSSEENYLGGITGRNTGTGTISNCRVSGNVSSDSRLVGGIAGENNGTISNCWVSGNVSSDWKNSSVAATAKVGGIAGENNGTIQYCCVTGNVQNDDADVGGLVGCNDGTLQHCTFYGERSSTHDQASIYSGNSANWENCYGVFNQGEYDAASGKDMYRHAIRYTYDVTVNIEGHGTVRTRALDEDDVPGTCAGQTFSLNVTSGTALNVTVTDADGNNVPLQGHANDNSSFWFVMPSKNVTATVTFGYTDWPTQGAGTVDDPYIISSAEDWNDFAYNVRIGRNYSGQYVKLTNDISVTTMAGGYQADDNCQPFSGTFDGDGHTLTLNVNNQSRFAAPFKCVSGAIIKNLRTAGTIDGTGNADGKLLAGIVGVSFGNTTISGCVSSVTLTTAFGWDAALAGLVAGTKGGSLTIEGCVFDGSMTGSSNTHCAGIAGFEYGGTTTSISNCLFTPTTLTVNTAENGYTKTISRDPDATITGCYYTQVLGAAQGTMAYVTDKTPTNIGSLVQDYGFMNAYQHGILFDGLYYLDSNYAPAFQLLKAATSGDVGKVVCAAGHLHDAKTAVPYGCTAVGILGRMTADGYGRSGLIIALQDAASQTWHAIDSWTSVTAYAGTTLKLLPDDNARGSLTSYTTLGETTVSNWCVAQKSDYEAIFEKLGSTTGDNDGKTYDANVNAYITTGVGGTAIAGYYWSATEYATEDDDTHYGWGFAKDGWWGSFKTDSKSVRPVLGFTFIASELPGTGTAGDPYTISNSDEWINFAYNVNSGNNYNGKYVKLTSDISVTTPVGDHASDSDNQPFSGTFLGDGHTITAALAIDGKQGFAPFRCINGATIRDLKVAGTIASNKNHTAGIAGFASGTNTIEDCLVTATLNISSDYAGGIIGHGLTSATTIRGCAFTGTVNGVDGNRSNIGGLWGWSNSGTPTLEGCLEAGTYTNIASMHPMGLQGGSGTITNCYYLNPQTGSPRNVCTVSGAKQAYAFTTAPANLGELVKDYGMVKAYANGILVDGTYYVAPATVTLADGSDNTAVITDANGYVANVTLAARTLYKDGKWNTLCLPFDVTIAGSPLAGATARPLTSASISGSTLTLTFGDAVTTLKAGTPYIIKWASGDNIVSPVFSGVTIDKTDRSYDNGISGDNRVRFLGTYKSTTFDAEDKSILLMGGENTLYYPTAGAGIGAQRAYFKIGDDGALLARRLTAFNIDFGDDETTGIISVHDSGFMVNGSDAWYSLDGRRLSAKPSRAGVYINNGIKVVIK